MSSTHFDQRAADWDADPAKVQRARAVAAAIRQNAPLYPRMTALEYGCGTGLLSFALHEDVGQIILADSSDGMLAVLREKIASAKVENLTPRKLDLATDALPAERFDLIYTLMTLHHIPDTDAILGKFHALLRDSGFLCIADLDKEDGSFHGPGFDVHNGFERAELTAKLQKAGFRQITSSIIYEVPREVQGQKKLFPLFLMIALKN